MPVLILVEPWLDQNVGSVARTMLNFGLWELRLVRPQCDHLSSKAFSLAAGADSVLTHAKIFNTTSEAVSDLHTVLASTCRPRHTLKKPLYSPKSAASRLFTSPGKGGLLLGAESSGLVTSDVELSHGILSIATHPGFSSLNLAQAANILCYECFAHSPYVNATSPVNSIHEKGSAASQGDISALVEKVHGVMNRVNFPADALKRVDAASKVRSWLQKHVSRGRGEGAFLHGLLSAVTKTIDSYAHTTNTRV